MAPIYVMAIVTTAVAGLGWMGPFWAMAGRFRSLLWLGLLTLPASALVNLLVKRPLALAASQEVGGEQPIWYLLFLLFLAPVTEEAVKALPALVPSVHRRLTEQGAGLWIGISLGIGFGLGEIWFLAWSIARSGAYATLPWWQFGGFLQERVLVTGMHGIMTAVCVTFLARGRWQGAAGYLGAVGLHALSNLGAFLYQRKVIPITLASVWLIVPLTLLLLLFTRMYRDERRAQPVAEEVLFERKPS